MSAPERTIPTPAVTPETRPFWDAAEEGRLPCQAVRGVRPGDHYPRSICPFCWSDRTEWVRVSGRGIIYSYSVMLRVPVPYAIAYVTLDERVTMMTNIVDCDLDAIRIGQPVRVVFRPTHGGPPVPMFTPA